MLLLGLYRRFVCALILFGVRCNLRRLLLYYRALANCALHGISVILFFFLHENPPVLPGFNADPIFFQ